MSSKTVRKLSVESLAIGIPVMPLEAVGFYKQNCMVCFDSQGHSSGVELEVHHEGSVEKFKIDWSGKVTERLRKAYGDLVQATEHAACALALLLIRELTEFTTIEQSSIGTTIDYYLAPKKQDEMLIFNRAARLEVSGILRESQSNTVEGRVKQKIRRLKQEGDLATFIVVVEFSKPLVRIVRL